jgi:hypothetical protein
MAVPTTVTIVGSMQNEAGCPGDWDPACAVTHLTRLSGGAWAGSFSMPSGSYAYAVAINDSWNESYGQHGTAAGPNIEVTLTAPAVVSFYYSEQTHWVTSSANAPIVTAAGSFQSELGCPGDWQPDCMSSWLQDVDGDGTATLTAAVAPGSYSTKVTLDRSWTINYGRSGVLGGANIDFVVPADAISTTFRYASTSHVLSITSTTPPRAPRASAGPDVRIGVGASATLDGRGSRDPQGRPLTFRWRQTAGPTVALAGAVSQRARFTPTVVGAYRFSLVVNNGALPSLPDNVLVTVVASATSVPNPKVTGGATAVLVSCPKQLRPGCRVSLALTTLVRHGTRRSQLQVATARATLAPGQRARVALPWTSAGLARLRPRGTLPVTLVTTTRTARTGTHSLSVAFTARLA